MNYFDLIQQFFEEIFEQEYLIVSIPFIVLVSGLSSGLTSYFYRLRIKDLKSQNEMLLLMNHQYNQAIHNIQQREELQASAPPMAYLYTYV